MEHSVFRDFFTKNKNVNWLIGIGCLLSFSLGNAFFSANFFTTSVLANVLICLLFGAIGVSVNFLFLQMHFSYMLSKSVINSIFRDAFFRLTMIVVSFASLVKGIFYFLFNGHIAFSAIIIPILFAITISGLLLAIIVVLVRGGFLRFENVSDGFKYVLLPFALLVLLKIMFLGVL